MSWKNKIIPAALLFFPALTVLWSLFLNHLSGPHFLSRSDPEYVYLLNGMNVALLNFDRIGHIDHPGTPFQLLTGIFIRLIHWTSGNSPLVEDLLATPEKYLALSSFFLSLITAWLFYRISVIAYRRDKDLIGALIIPAAFFFYAVIIDLPSRYIPDRLLMIDLLLFSAVCIKYFYLGYPAKKFALLSGFIIALGLVTKINFLPFVILPVFIITGIRYKLYYGVSLVFSSILLFLPVYDKFSYFWGFAKQITQHDSLYGSGNAQVLNPAVFKENLLHIVNDNPALLFILFLSTIVFFVLLFNASKRKNYKIEFLFITGFLVVAAAGIVMVAKHYKNYYMIPILSISGLALYVSWVFSEKFRIRRYAPHVVISAGLLFIVLAFVKMAPGWQKRSEVLTYEKLTHNFIRDHVPSSAYFYIEPTWMAGPMVTNGLVYGISYIGHRFKFYNEYEKVYPNVITFEGNDRPLKYFRMIDADNEALLKSGKDFYLLSTPGRNASLLLNYLDSCARDLNISLEVESLFRNDFLNSEVLRIRNASGWSTKVEARCGFEQDKEGIIHTDDGKYALYGNYGLTDRKPPGGNYALKLEGQMNQSPMYAFKGVVKGDYIQATIKRKRSKGVAQGALIAEFKGFEGDVVSVREEGSISLINPRWELVRVNFTVEVQPADSILLCYYKNSTEGVQILDDFALDHYTKSENPLLMAGVSTTTDASLTNDKQ